MRKGTNKGVDSYSGFGDAFEGRWEKTELADKLHEAGITDVRGLGRVDGAGAPTQHPLVVPTVLVLTVLVSTVRAGIRHRSRDGLLCVLHGQGRRQGRYAHTCIGGGYALPLLESNMALPVHLRLQDRCGRGRRPRHCCGVDRRRASQVGRNRHRHCYVC